MTVKIIDRGFERIKRELMVANGLNVAVGILSGSVKQGQAIADYAAANEYGTSKIPARPFMSTAFDEDTAKIKHDYEVQFGRIVKGQASAREALSVIGLRHAQKIKSVISGRDILPMLSESTIKGKKGSSKTLIDTGAMVNSVQISIRKGRK